MVCILRCPDVGSCDTHATQIIWCTRSRLIVIVHDVHRHGLPAITTIFRPVIDDVVAKVHSLVLLGKGTRTESGCARGVMSYQVVMIRGSASSPIAAISVLAFLVAGIVQTLCYDAPLYREVLIAKYGQTLVYGPTDRAMIHYDIMTSAASQSVTLMMSYLSVAQSEAHISDDVI